MRRRVNPNIDLAPLLDTMFLLLIFFLFAAINISSQKQLPLTLPKIVEAQQQVKDYNQIIIRQNGILLNSKPATYQDLSGLDPNKRVYLAAGEELSYGQVIKVLNILKQHNIHNVALESR